MTLRIVSSIAPTEFLACVLAAAPLWIFSMTCSASPPSISTVRLISSVALRVSLASAFTSLATTAKVRPCSPARMASMVALSARILVVSAIWSISWLDRRTWSIAAAKPVTCSVSVSTRLRRLPISLSELLMSVVPSFRRSMARSESKRASSLASRTLLWSSSRARTVPCNSTYSLRRWPKESITP